ncbi:hypothetical protein [uncultured Microbacterium sp.]|uniref:hypothetical protein n=1 Tax=uncultured Microbacterium sp. TaxID=191216 RepID=UPI0026328C33|nr:hypothetical protein [uncultured Microbacterium sp.]
MMRSFMSALGILSVGLIGLSGCAPQGPATREPEPTVTASVSGQAALDGIEEDVLAEYDTFFAAQNYPDDETSPLTATTPAQEAFVAEQQAVFAERGWEWNPDEQTIALSLAFEGCGVAILNEHDVNAELLRHHVAFSELFDYLIEPGVADDQRLIAEADFAGTMVSGALHLCPDDGARWAAAYREVYES